MLITVNLKKVNVSSDYGIVMYTVADKETRADWTLEL